MLFEGGGGNGGGPKPVVDLSMLVISLFALEEE